jgi:hypothetical protein
VVEDEGHDVSRAKWIVHDCRSLELIVAAGAFAMRAVGFDNPDREPVWLAASFLTVAGSGRFPEINGPPGLKRLST